MAKTAKGSAATYAQVVSFTVSCIVLQGSFEDFPGAAAIRLFSLAADERGVLAVQPNERLSSVLSRVTAHISGGRRVEVVLPDGELLRDACRRDPFATVAGDRVMSKRQLAAPPTPARNRRRLEGKQSPLDTNMLLLSYFFLAREGR